MQNNSGKQQNTMPNKKFTINYKDYYYTYKLPQIS